MSGSDLAASPFTPKQEMTIPGDSSVESFRGVPHIDIQPPVPMQANQLNTLSMALLSQQLPSLPNYSGDSVDEGFDNWLERLELVATTCGWSDQAKLMNVATRLRGAAARFYRSCTPQQRSNYSALTTVLRQRFTPVRIQSVQSSKFHERKQLPTETVDMYAQDLRKLFYQAYSHAEKQGDGAEMMGQSVLAYNLLLDLPETSKTS